MNRAISPYFDTFIDRWPPQTAALSMESHLFQLDEHNVEAFLSQDKTTRQLLGLNRRLPFSADLTHWVSRTTTQYALGVFARLNACSFVRPDRPPRPLTKGEEVHKLMMHPGERAASLAWRTVRARRDLYLCLRPWRSIPPWSEFRLFIHRRQLTGISQYHHNRTYSQIEAEIHTIHPTLIGAASIILETIHLDSVVADVYVSGASWELIELNPHMRDCGAALFSWTKPGDFDGSFRYLAPDGDLISIKPT